MVSRFRAVGLYHDLNFKDDLQDLRTPFEPLTPIEESTHTPVEVHEVHRKPHAKLPCTKHLTNQKTRGIQTILNNISPKDIPQLEQELMSLPKLTPEK